VQKKRRLCKQTVWKRILHPYFPCFPAFSPPKPRLGNYCLSFRLSPCYSKAKAFSIPYYFNYDFYFESAFPFEKAHGFSRPKAYPKKTENKAEKTS
jgi:hypothetical protein